MITWPKCCFIFGICCLFSLAFASGVFKTPSQRNIESAVLVEQGILEGFCSNRDNRCCSCPLYATYQWVVVKGSISSHWSLGFTRYKEEVHINESWHILCFLHFKGVLQGPVLRPIRFIRKTTVYYLHYKSVQWDVVYCSSTGNNCTVFHLKTQQESLHCIFLEDMYIHSNALTSLITMNIWHCTK